MPVDEINSWGQLLLYVVIGLVTIGFATLRNAIRIYFESAAESQTEEKDAMRVLKFAKVIDDGFETVQRNIIAEADKDLRAALADGVLDADERSVLRATMADYSRKTLGEYGMKAVKDVYGIADEAFDDWAANRLEGSVIAQLLETVVKIPADDEDGE